MDMWWVWVYDLGHQDGQRVEASCEDEAARRFVDSKPKDELFPDMNDGNKTTICVAPFVDGIEEQSGEPEHERLTFRLGVEHRYTISRC